VGFIFAVVGYLLVLAQALASLLMIFCLTHFYGTSITII
jgi:hypothetical protein